MSNVFTSFVRSLEATGEPNPEGFQEVWKALRRALRGELRRRGLWESSPSFLGVFGASGWTKEETNGGSAPRDALDELVADCYVYNFVERLRCLRAQLLAKDTIDGYVYRNIRNFLFEAQRRHDPLGYRVYAVLKRTLKKACGDGRLHILDGGPRIRNDTVLGFAATAEPALGPDAEIAARTLAWNDEILPELVTARGDDEDALVERLEELIAALAADGVESFRFKDLIDPLKQDVRARWAALWQSGEGETVRDEDGEELAELVRFIEPDTSVEELERFEKLAVCVERKLARREGRQKTRDYLRRLWRFLRVFSVAANGSAEAKEEAALTLGDQLPSNRELSKLLQVPRERFADLFATLRPEIERCLASVSRLRAARPAWRAAAGVENGKTSARKLEATLLRLTAEAWSDAALPEGAPEGRAGEIVVFPQAADQEVEWAVLSEDAGRVLVVPVDSKPWLGSKDVAAPPLILRCGAGIRIAGELLETACPTGTLRRGAVARALRAVEAGTVASEAPRLETDADPEYQEWTDVLRVAATSLGQLDWVRRKKPTSMPAGTRQTPVRWVEVHPLALAATALLAAGLGLAGGWWSNDRALDAELERKLGEERAPLELEIQKLREASGRSRVNLPIVWLTEVGRERGPEETLPPGSEDFIVVLTPPEDEPPDATYRIEVVGRSGEVAFAQRGLREVGVAELVLILSARELASEEVELRLYREGSEDVVARYRMRLQ